MSYFLTYLYVALLYLRPQEFVEDIRGWPIMEYLAYLSIAVTFLQGYFKSEVFKRSPISAILCAFWAALCLSNLANFWFGGAADTFKEFAKIVILFFLIVFNVDTWPRVRAFAWLLVFCSTFLAVQAIVQYFTGVGLVGGQAMLREGEIMQATGIGIFADPNDLALNIVPMMAFVLPAFHRRFLSRTWLTGLPFLLTMTVGVFYTHSRGGMLSLAGLGWYYLRRRVGGVASLVGLWVILTVMISLPRMGDLSPEESSAHSRLELWAYGLEVFQSHPLFGVGYGQFIEGEMDHTAHNSFVLAFSETGFLGATIWVCLFLAAFRELMLMRKETRRGPPFLDEYVDSMTGALIAWQVAAFFLSQTFKPLSFILMALVVSGQNALAREGVTLKNRWGLRQVGQAVGLTVAGIIVMHLMVKFLWKMG